jgi:NAD(P)-dependent dehydrogenase (short-subunit alcohol dehydrogenase family)
MRDLRALMDMRGRRALITGGAGYLGRTMADSLAELGAELILVDAPGASTQKVADDISKRHNTNVTALHFDLENIDDRTSLFGLVEKEGLSVLINNAAFVGTTGLTGWAEPFEQQSVETWRRALEVNLTASFHLCQLFSSSLKNGPGASIINIGSIYGIWGPDFSLYEGTGMANPAAYGASKGGLIQFTRWLATALAPDVRANVIAPGGVARGQPKSFVKRYTERTPLKRMATEEDFRGAVAYLASDLSAYVTGQVLSVDGGWGIW